MTYRFINNQNLAFTKYTECHGGVGEFMFRDLLTNMDSAQRNTCYLRGVHEDVIRPGASFGVHKEPSGEHEEWYYCVSGKATMIVEDEEIPMLPGDICITRADEHHGIRNDGVDDLRILVMVVIPPEK